jgi:hypothetical protein
VAEVSPATLYVLVGVLAALYGALYGALSELRSFHVAALDEALEQLERP